MKSALAILASATILSGCQNASLPMRTVSDPINTSPLKGPALKAGGSAIIVTTGFDDSIEHAYFTNHLLKVARNFYSESLAIRQFPIGRFAVCLSIKEDGSFDVLGGSTNIVGTPTFDSIVRALRIAAPFPPWTPQMKRLVRGSFLATIEFDTTPMLPKNSGNSS